MEDQASVANSGSNEGLEIPKDARVLLVPTAPAKKTKLQAPQDAIDDFWATFTSKSPGKATKILPKNSYVKKVEDDALEDPVKSENALVSYEEAAKICNEKVDKIVQECRRVNQKYRDLHFDIEFDLKWGVGDCLTMLSSSPDANNSGFEPGSVKRVSDIFDKPEFYVKGPTANDVRQGRDGDCWFMAALCTLGNKQGLIEKVCVARDEKVGVYGFVFYRDGEWRSEVVDDKLYLTRPDYDESWVERNLIEDRQRINSEEDYRQIYQSNSGALYFAQCEDPNETWLPLIEKAYAKAHGDYAAIEGGFTGEGLEDLTGGVTTELFSTDILDKEFFWKEELLKVNEDFLFGCASSIFWGRGYRKGIYEGHAYSIMRAVEIDGRRLCLLRNPWGKGEWNGPWSDGSKEWTSEWMQKLDHQFGDDGAFWISYDDLLKKYQTFDRTRLFNDEWKVTQQWTSLKVPWTVSYHDTKFSFVLERKAPVVIVLSQLDDRYFRGLEGQYSFELSFRVHKSGDDDYVMRSHGNYSMRRSVTADLELEAGEYHVLMKVEAIRDADIIPVEQVVRNNAKKRRDKLLRIGLSYDLAHARGSKMESEEAKRGKKKAEKEEKEKKIKEIKVKLMKEKLRRKHVSNKELKKERIASKKRKNKERNKAKKREDEEKAKKEEGKKGPEKEKLEKAKLATEKPTDDDSDILKEGISKDAKNEQNPKIESSDLEIANPASEAKGVGNSISEKAVSREPETASDPQPNDTAPASSLGIVKLDIPIKVSTAFSSAAELSDSSSDDSDLDSCVSDISDGLLEEEYEIQKTVKETEDSSIAAVTSDKDEDEIEKDPWNAIAVVGLRIYCKGSSVSVKILKKIEREDGTDQSGGEARNEDKLDVDDSARDAVAADDKKT